MSCQGIDRAGGGGADRGHDQKGAVALCAVGCDQALQHLDVQSLCGVTGDAA